MWTLDQKTDNLFREFRAKSLVDIFISFQPAGCEPLIYLKLKCSYLIEFTDIGITKSEVVAKTQFFWENPGKLFTML